MALENKYIINVDIKKQFTSRHIAFRRGDNGVIVFRLFDDGEEYNINSATKAVLHQSTPSGMKLSTECQFTSVEGKQVIRYEYEKIAMVELGYNTLMLVVYDGDTAVSIQPFSVTIYDDLEDGADSYLELIQDLMKIIDDLTIDLNNTIKLSEKGIPNGVATLDKDGKIPLSQMPNSLQAYINHITETVYLNKVHGMSITTDGIMQYMTPNGVQNVGFAPDANGGGGSGGQVLSASVKVKDGVATVTYNGAPSVNAQKWATGDRNKAYFATNGNTFSGTTFSVAQSGSHTLWYKDSNGNEYVVLFVVTSDQLAPISISVTVEDGVVSVDIGESVQVKKWDNGTRTVEYFQYNGNVFAGNAFTVSEVGTYTIYYKTIGGVESVYTFEVTEDMLPIYSEPVISINSLSLYENTSARYAIVLTVGDPIYRVTKYKGVNDTNYKDLTNPINAGEYLEYYNDNIDFSSSNNRNKEFVIGYENEIGIKTEIVIYGDSQYVYYWEKDSSEANLIGFLKINGNFQNSTLSLPSVIVGKSIVSIGQRYGNVMLYDDNIINLTIPASVSKLYAIFAASFKLESVTVLNPNMEYLKSYNNYAFESPSKTLTLKSKNVSTTKDFVALMNNPKILFSSS